MPTKRPTDDTEDPLARRLTKRVNEALVGVDPPAADRVRDALAGYIADRDDARMVTLLWRLHEVIGQDAALALLDKQPRHGRVWCSTVHGWVTPEVKFDHIYSHGNELDGSRTWPGVRAPTPTSAIAVPRRSNRRVSGAGTPASALQYVVP